jgi:hypothetical protein
VRQTLYGFHVHVRLEWPGVIARFGVTPANAHELAALPALAEQTTDTLLGDRDCWSPARTSERRTHVAEVPARYRSAKRDPHGVGVRSSAVCAPASTWSSVKWSTVAT